MGFLNEIRTVNLLTNSFENRRPLEQEGKKMKKSLQEKKFENYFRNKVAEISVILFSFFSASIEKLFVTLFF